MITTPTNKLIKTLCMCFPHFFFLFFYPVLNFYWWHVFLGLKKTSLQIKDVLFFEHPLLLLSKWPQERDFLSFQQAEEAFMYLFTFLPPPSLPSERRLSGCQRWRCDGACIGFACGSIAEQRDNKTDRKHNKGAHCVAIKHFHIVLLEVPL